jgi:hypothetical protein
MGGKGPRHENIRYHRGQIKGLLAGGIRQFSGKHATHIPRITPQIFCKKELDNIDQLL